MTRSVECNRPSSTMEGTVTKQCGGTGVKKGFKIVLLDGRPSRSSVRQLKTES